MSMTTEYSVYKITDKDTNRCYIGLTKQAIERRFQGHRHLSKKGASRCMSNTFNFDNCDLECLEKIATNDIKEARWRERFHMENTECVNKCKPVQTLKERKEMILKHKLANALEYKCDCGATIRRDSKYRHELSKKHQKYLSSLYNEPVKQ